MSKNKNNNKKSTYNSKSGDNTLSDLKKYNDNYKTNKIIENNEVNNLQNNNIKNENNSNNNIKEMDKKMKSNKTIENNEENDLQNNNIKNENIIQELRREKEKQKFVNIETLTKISKLTMEISEKNESLRMMNEELEYFFNEYNKEKHNHNNTTEALRNLENKIYI